MPTLGKCRSCGAPIIWVTMAGSGKKNPLDSLPTEKGNIVLHQPGDTASVLNAEELAAVNKREPKPNFLYLSHFATCKFAKQHKKAKTE